MIQLDKRINTPIKIPFAEANGTTGLVAFSSVFLKDGDNYVGLAPTYSEIGNGIYTMDVTFTETGVYTVIIDDAISAVVNVVEKDFYSILQDLDDVAQGSWVYDKAASTLRLIRQDGSDLASFDVVDDVDISSRERQ